MKTATHTRWAWLAALALCVAGWTLPAGAGIPRPGLILYGQVKNDAGGIITAGRLIWTFTPASGGGAPVVVETLLAETIGPGGPYSYAVTIPFETAVPGFAVSPGALAVSATPREYVQEARTQSGGIVTTATVLLSSADVGSVKRVDVCNSCAPGGGQLRSFHSADIDKNLRFSLGEFLRVIELHTATPDHAYHAALGTVDGYSPGAGSRTGLPHSGDFYGGADWRISIHEIVRMIDLFASTPGHAYLPDSQAEDGFRKDFGGKSDGPIGAEASMAKAGVDPGGMRAHRVVRGGGIGAGNRLDITLHLDYTGGDPLSALGVIERLPEGWTLDGIAGDGGALVQPAPGSEGALDFAWYPVPSFPMTFQYSVRFPVGSDVGAAFAALGGEAIHRTLSGETQHSTAILPYGTAGGEDDGAPGGGQVGGQPELPGNEGGIGADGPGPGILPGGPEVDSDGDGIPDWREGTGDSDGDGIPDFLDEDSDNDGLTDEEERLSDGDPGYDPYHPINNPTGTDLDATNPDTDGDGIPDGEEVQSGSDPISRASKPKGVPVGGAAGLMICAAAMLVAGARKTRRRG